VIAVLFFGLLAGVQAVGQGDKQGEALLQAAKNTELVKGDLNAAIEQYKKILARSGVGRTVAAKALLEMGQCYEKLGQAEARNAYEQLVRQYADQAEQAQTARARLAALGGAPNRIAGTDMAVRRLLPDTAVDATGGASPDGRYLSITDPESGDLAVLEIGTGQKRRLTNKDNRSRAEGAFFSKWSRDGKKIAYLWLNKDMSPELRIIGSDGSEPRILPEAGWPLDWSPDSKYILARVAGKNGSFDLALIPTAGGSLNILKIAQTVFRAACSPDGKYIVYELPQQKDSAPYDLSMLSIDGKQEVPLVKHPANDRLLGWIPGTDFILFTSDRTGTQDAWALRVANGQPQADPVLVKQDIGQASPMGITNEGSFCYSLMRSIVEAYEVSLDLGKGAVAAPPRKIFERVVGRNYPPEWSPDGKYLAYVSERKAGSAQQSPYFLCIRSDQTGEEREIPLPIQSFWTMHWSAGSDAVFATMTDKANQGLFKIDIQTGKQALLARGGADSLIKNFAVSPDARSVYYAHFQWAKKLVPIIRYDLKTGQENEVYRKAAPPDIGSLAFSPDGKYLSFSTADDLVKLDHVIRIMPASGGETRDLLGGKLESFSNHVWTSDGKTILFVKRTGGAKEEKRELWQIPSEGGEPRKIDIKMELNDIRLHPDGRRIAFTAGKTTTEIWVMENFMAVLKPAR
jgi:Tol biopolymer transport system component